MSKSDFLQIRIDPYKKAKWAQAAAAESLPLSRWVERACDDELAAWKARQATAEPDGWTWDGT